MVDDYFIPTYCILPKKCVVKEVFVSQRWIRDVHAIYFIAGGLIFLYRKELAEFASKYKIIAGAVLLIATVAYFALGRLNSGFAVKRYKKFARMNKRTYQLIFGKCWLDETDKYIRDLVDFEFPGYWHGDVNEQPFMLCFVGRCSVHTAEIA